MCIKKFKITLLILLLTSTSASAYQANCKTDNNRSFSITVKNKVLTVDGRFSHWYQGKTLMGWYEYSNSKYLYKTGPFEHNGFPIEVTNSKQQLSKGYCYFY